MNPRGCYYGRNLKARGAIGRLHDEKVVILNGSLKNRAGACYSGIFLKRYHAIPPNMRGMSHAAGMGGRIPVYPKEREVA